PRPARAELHRHARDRPLPARHPREEFGIRSSIARVRRLRDLSPDRPGIPGLLPRRGGRRVPPSRLQPEPELRHDARQHARDPREAPEIGVRNTRVSRELSRRSPTLAGPLLRPAGPPGPRPAPFAVPVAFGAEGSGRSAAPRPDGRRTPPPTEAPTSMSPPPM